MTTTMMTATQLALLTAIIANPDEDTPRLAYADLLDEIGGKTNHARAEFIRLQCRHPRCDPPNSPDNDLSRARAEKLLNRHRSEWEAGLPGVESVIFERGFVDTVFATGGAFVQHAKAWFCNHPVIRAALHDVAENVAEVMVAAHSDCVRELSLNGDVRDADLAAIVAAPRPGGTGCYPHLEDLRIEAEGSVSARGVLAILGCEMPRLRRLLLLGMAVCDFGAFAVAETTGFANLQSLGFIECDVGNAGLRALLRSEPRAGLSALWLSGCRITADGVDALADMPGGLSFEKLDLSDNPITSVNVDRLGAALDNYPNLWLDLRDCPIPLTTQGELVWRFGNRVSVGCE